MKKLPLRELKARARKARGSRLASMLADLDNDARLGARQLAQSVRREIDRGKREKRRLRNMSLHELRLLKAGCTRIGGVDEVGRGALAGPLVAAAVILRPGALISGINDSKKLSPTVRISLAEKIKIEALCWAVVEVSHDEIDRSGIHRANLLALSRAARALEIEPDHVLCDGFRVDLRPIPSTRLVRGDSISQTIAAASILAKVHRDKLMETMAAQFKQYGLAQNKGYASGEHLDALRRYGPSRIHRRSFDPCRGDQFLQQHFDFDF